MTLTLWIIRHGKAHKLPPTGTRDRDRTLTARGIAQAHWLAAQLTHPAPLILASPITRAAHTAAIIADTLRATPRTDDRLATDQPIEPIIEMLDESFEHTTSIAVVGHNPTLSELAAALAGGHHRPPELRTGEAILLTFTKRFAPHAGTLVRTLRLDDDD